MTDIDKPGGLGVLDSYGRLESMLKGIVKNTRKEKTRAGVMKQVRLSVKDMRFELRASRKNGKELEKAVNSIVAKLTQRSKGAKGTKGVLQLIDGKEKKDPTTGATAGRRPSVSHK